MGKKVYIRSLGCQMNEYDSEKMAEVMGACGGYETTADPDEADLILFNTCSVREKAQEKVFSDLGRVKHLKRKGVYFRASWTLRVDLLSDFVCRLLSHMDKKGVKQVEVTLRPEDKDMPISGWIDPNDFNPGYLMRSMHLLPQRGDKPEWQHTQDYWTEKVAIPAIDLDGKEFIYR